MPELLCESRRLLTDFSNVEVGNPPFFDDKATRDNDAFHIPGADAK